MALYNDKIGSIHQEDIIIINLYMSNNKMYEAKTDRLEGEIKNSTIIVGDINTLFSIL